MTANHWDVERRLYLPPGSKADAELIIHETLRGEGIEIQGFLVRPCDCHPHNDALIHYGLPREKPPR